MEKTEIKNLNQMKLGTLLTGDIVLFLMALFLFALALGLTPVFQSRFEEILSLKDSSLIQALSFVLAIYILLCAMALLSPKLKPGIYALGDPQVKKWFFSFIFARLWNYELIRYPLFAFVFPRWIFLWCLGAKVSLRTSISSDARFYDVHMITLGEGCVVGMNARIVPHFIAQGKLVLQEIKIGKNVMVGYQVTLGSGVTIGDDAEIEVNVSVMPFTSIPAGYRATHHSVIDRATFKAQ